MNIRNRQDAVLRSLRRSGISTVNELAIEVGASRRTILRDIGALREAGYIIHSDVGRGGGLQLDAHSMQTTARLSVQEVFGLLISVAAMRAVWNLPFSGFADAGLAKIEKSLPADRLTDLRALLGCLHIGKLSPLQDLTDAGPVDPALLTHLETALLQRRKLRFDYRDAKGRSTQRCVEAQAMLILPPLWYLVAWDDARGDFRHFRMDRIRDVTVIEGSNFRRRKVPFGDDVCPYEAMAR